MCLSKIFGKEVVLVRDEGVNNFVVERSVWVRDSKKVRMIDAITEATEAKSALYSKVRHRRYETQWNAKWLGLYTFARGNFLWTDGFRFRVGLGNCLGIGWLVRELK